ncbi:PREDICTED: TMV resistance protein N-like [Prunus mume]|uniref:TMV resistance protein N-like n=1 Tax=Prunus mume TaxID=102107 RepID=A0ABM0PA92_PRUMU|nr:PREDICTED: TMV resistance protein N-like [Prunus mume]
MEYNITTEPAASSSSPSTHQWKYDVFLSFRGADTRVSIVDLLYSSLLNWGIDTFWDEDQLKREGDIPREIFEAIEKSRISVVIFSKNYASSTWCLDELAKIIECKNSQQQIVLPIFYDVNPSDVRKQTGTFGEAFVEHEVRFKDDLGKVSRWKAALTEATKSFVDEIKDFPLFPNDFLEAPGLAGMVVKDGYDGYKFINAIIEKILRQLKRTYLAYETDYLVGIDSRLREVNDLLGVGVDAVRMVGISGIRGMGKTILAKAIYNQVAHKFKASCFLGNVRENSKGPGGLVDVQKSLLYDIPGLNVPRVTNVDSGVNIIKSRLHGQKILLIIDDVDQLDQLKYLAGSSDWFGAGSRIIITTRDEDLLHAHGVPFTYQVKKSSG